MNKTVIPIYKIYEHNRMEKEDYIAVEKEISIHLSDGKVITTTCSPGYEEEMILGYRYSSGDYEHEVSSGQAIHTVTAGDLLAFADKVYSMPQELFSSTGCAHSCAIVCDGKILCHMEDIRRHNALDKAVGYAVKHNISPERVIVYTSGRISADYLQKTINAGIRIIVSRAAVTDAAIELAKKNGITLLGFARNGRANLYHEGNVTLI